MKKRVINRVVFLIVSLNMVCCSDRSFETSEQYLAKVNNVIISVQEFSHFMKKNRAMIYNDFYQKYAAEDSKDFWTKKIGNKIPIEVLKEKTLGECIRIKIQQILAREKNIIKDISYSSFLDSLRKENMRRKRAFESKKIIYGPVEFSEQSFFNYVFSTMVIQLKKRLAEEEFNLVEDKLIEYYRQNKDNDYKRQDFVKVLKISISDQISIESQDLRNESERLMKEIQQELNNGMSADIISENKKYENITVIEQVFDDSTAFVDERLYFQLKKIAMKMSVGEISKVIEDDSGFHVLKCIERKNRGYIRYEEVAENLKSDFINEQYNVLIDELMEEAKIKINKKVYDSIEDVF